MCWPGSPRIVAKHEMCHMMTRASSSPGCECSEQGESAVLLTQRKTSSSPLSFCFSSLFSFFTFFLPCLASLKGASCSRSLALVWCSVFLSATHSFTAVLLVATYQGVLFHGMSWTVHCLPNCIS